jgi:hypothetical protein
MTHSPEPVPAGRAATFDPREAEVLLARTTLSARRDFEPDPPWLLTTRAVLALVAYGAVWLSVRGQHPYRHPTAALIPVGIAVGAVSVVATIVMAKRASAGVSGRPRLRAAEIVIVAALWAALFVAMAVMAVDGVSDRIVYGLFPATVPIIVAGLTWSGITAARADWRACAAGLVTAAVGAVAWFAGPAGAWAVVGVGVCVILLERAAEIVWRQHT